MQNRQRGRHQGRNNQRGHSRPAQRGPKKEYIHPSKFVQKASQVEKVEYQAEHRFEDFDVTPELAKRLKDRNFSSPSPIQDQIIPHGLSGRDVIGIANTGTGKTMAFAIPVIQRLLTNPNSKAIILAPTRELAIQVLDECKTLIGDSRIYWSLIIGGAPMNKQLRELSYNPALIIGTPGRIKDHMQRRSLDLSKFDVVVLDEVDRMLDMGFVNDMREILGQMPRQSRQSFFFSATIDAKVRSIIDQFSQDPISVSVKTGDTTDTVEQDIVSYTRPEEKIDKLHDVLISKNNSKVLIFDDTRRQVDRLSKTLAERGFKSDALHGGKSQGQRKRALDKFKQSHTNVLVATDVAARGIDISGITHVINYTQPQTYDDYVHRIGRAGRAGNTGYALTFVEDPGSPRHAPRPRY